MPPNPRRNHRSSAGQEATTAMAPRETRAASRPREAPGTVAMDEKVRAQVVDSSSPSAARGDKAQHHKNKHHRHHHHHKSRDSNSCDTKDYDIEMQIPEVAETTKASTKPSNKSSARSTLHSDSHHRKKKHHHHHHHTKHHRRENVESFETMQDDVEMQVLETTEPERAQSSSSTTTAASSATSRIHRHSSTGLRQMANSTRHGNSNNRSTIYPGAVRVAGINRERDGAGTVWDPSQDEEPSALPQSNEIPEIATAELVREKDIVPAVRELPWIRQRKNQCILLCLLLVLVGAIVGLVIPLASKSDPTPIDSRPPNDNCQEAIGPLSIPSSTDGSTALATIANVSECGTASGDGETIGVWFTVVGNGHILSVSTCNSGTSPFDTHLSIFADGDGKGCDSLQCINGSGDACSISSHVSWLSKMGGRYYVFVHAASDKTGNFRLELVDLGLANDDCEDAVSSGLLRIPSSTDGSTSLATLDSVDKCGTASGGDTLGVWYALAGNGNVLSVSTCNSATTLKAQLSVFIGRDCASLQCIDGSNEDCSVRSGVRWVSDKGALYYVLVHGVSGEPGDFRLDAEDLGTPPRNDACKDAIGPLVIPSSTEGSTSLATVKTITECGTASGGETLGVWYTLVGTGSVLSVSTCSTATLFNTQISVFSGSNCASLQCTDGNDNECGLQSHVTWVSKFDELYYIFVHGAPGVAGEFRLDVQQPVCMDFDCGEGYLLRENPETRVGDDRETCCFRESLRLTCVAVISESSQSDSYFDANWAYFRRTYPERPFCLLQPESGSERLYRPASFDSDPLTIFSIVNRDHGNPAERSDWFDVCDLDNIQAGITNIALFVDNSGSLVTADVQASYDLFLQKLADKGLRVIIRKDVYEDWITPFDIELA